MSVLHHTHCVAALQPRPLQGIQALPPHTSRPCRASNHRGASLLANTSATSPSIPSSSGRPLLASLHSHACRPFLPHTPHPSTPAVSPRHSVTCSADSTASRSPCNAAMSCTSTSNTCGTGSPADASSSSSSSSSRLQRRRVACGASSSDVPFAVDSASSSSSSSSSSSGSSSSGSSSAVGLARLSSWWGGMRKNSGFLDSKYDGEIWSVALPALAAMLLDPVMGVMNSAIVGRIGTQQLGAVSVGSLVVSFCTYLFSFLLFLTTPEIAAAMVQGDTREVSRISSKGFWLSGFLGLATAATLMLGGPAIIALMNPPEVAVSEYAIQYIGVRAWGIPSVLAGFVAIGTYRGFKDTRTPLYAAAGAAGTSFVFNLLFIYGMGWGVWGSGLATTLAQYVSSVSLCVLLVQKDMLKLQDLVRPPSLVSILPLLRRGLVLTLRNVISFGMVMYASVLCVRAGSAYQASFEVVRQVWIVTIQFFECLNVATQTMCASFLGAQDRASAAGVLQRVLFLGVSVGGILGLLLACSQEQVSALFSKDPLVMEQVMLTLPLVCALFPLDAAASILDGSLLAAKQTDYMSVVQIIASVLQYVTLAYIASHDLVSNLSIWAVLKVLSLFRCVGGVYRDWFSKHSAYKSDGVMSTVPTTLELEAAEAAAAAAGVASSSSKSEQPSEKSKGGGAASVATQGSTADSSSSSSSSSSKSSGIGDGGRRGSSCESSSIGDGVGGCLDSGREGSGSEASSSSTAKLSSDGSRGSGRIGSDRSRSSELGAARSGDVGSRLGKGEEERALQSQSHESVGAGHHSGGGNGSHESRATGLPSQQASSTK